MISLLVPVIDSHVTSLIQVYYKLLTSVLQGSDKLDTSSLQVSSLIQVYYKLLTSVLQGSDKLGTSLLQVVDKCATR